MTRLFRTIHFAIALLAVATLIAPAAHAQDQPPYPPPPNPPQPYPPPYPPPPNPPPYAQQRRMQRDHADFAVGVTGQYTQPMTSDGPASVWTTDSTGLLLSLRVLPVAGAGVELNYQYTKFSEVYNSPVGGGVFVSTTVPTSFREVTGAFLFHSHNVWGAQPFLSLGGGGIDFVPRVNGAHNQWRGAGLAELGFDLPVTKFCGVRLQGRSLFYRAPNFNNSALQSRTWVATVDPSASFYVRW
jgi:hypothetical protein